ncbi:ATP-binding cassette domain-containing protein, partial [Klebsiella aerogenes]|uniref:ATP-binding cassette domain-containing protein n=1 Tax=Klebsiella aerogenes TaxID=548 RepID=UPI001D0D9D73
GLGFNRKFPVSDGIGTDFQVKYGLFPPDDVSVMIEIKNLTLQRGLKVLLDKASAAVNPGQRVGLIGKNGTGKSSLFALIKGEITQDGVDISIPKNWRLASVSQETPDLDISALDYVLQGDAELQAFQTALRQAEVQNDGMKQAEYHAKLEEID